MRFYPKTLPRKFTTTANTTLLSLSTVYRHTIHQTNTILQHSRTCCKNTRPESTIMFFIFAQILTKFTKKKKLVHFLVEFCIHFASSLLPKSTDSPKLHTFHSKQQTHTHKFINHFLSCLLISYNPKRITNGVYWQILTDFLKMCLIFGVRHTSYMNHNYLTKKNRLYDFLDILQTAKHTRNAICTVTAQARTKIGDLGKALASSSFLPSSVLFYLLL